MPFDIQKALHLSKALEKKSFDFSKSSWALMPKLDGWYVYIDCLEGRWQELSSSACRVIPALAEYSNELKKVKSLTKSTRLIFEATIPGMEFHEMNGVLNRKYELAENVVFNLHDVVIFEESHRPFNLRYETAKEFYLPELQNVLLNSVRLIPILEKTSEISVFKDKFVELSEAGEEGVIAKRLDAGYSFGKRNNDILKLKAEFSCDYKIKNYFWTRGDKGNDAMNLTLQMKNGTEFNVVVNRHSAIETILNMGEAIVGKIAEIKAMEVMETGMLRQPVFKDFRFNKTEID
jgi:hypothetical protein